jgi:tRNA (guanine37-N1)-methyltransferase
VQVDVGTLFPEIFDAFLSTSMVGRAVESGALVVRREDLRPFGLGKHKSVDDTPYGGGSGMVMRVDCIVACLEALDLSKGDAPRPPAHRVLLTPQGEPLRQAKAHELAARERVVLVCGRYEGFDERVRAFVHEEVSLGDFVMTGGEIAAMAIIDACARLLPGVLGNAESAEHESHSESLAGMLEYPHYTRPVEFRGARVPDVLASGNHAAIATWRREQTELRTRTRRPDLLERRAADAASRPGGTK